MKQYLSILGFLSLNTLALAQADSTLFRRQPQDTAKAQLNMDAVYNRPFLGLGKTPVSVGGYVEGNWQYRVSNGLTEGHQFQAQRLTLFISSGIGKRLKFLTEIEFEEGAREIAIEFASLDLELHPMLNLRSGIIMNPIGAFNQNHDGPKWEFVDRPISATQMLPATWSNAGFGLYGKKYKGNWMFGYEIYLSGSFDNTIIDNPLGKTYLPEAKNNPNRFEEINSGLPLTSGKIAMRHRKMGELGLSYMGGVYNKFLDDGLTVDSKRRLDVIALDYNNTLSKWKTYIFAEWAWILVDVPATYGQQYGNRQHGGFLDIVQPILSKPMLGWQKATLNLACRLEYVDWNVGEFVETGSNIGEDTWSIMPAISFRPSPQTVFRLNYRYQQQADLFSNPPVKTGAVLFGFSSYF